MVKFTFSNVRITCNPPIEPLGRTLYLPEGNRVASKNEERGGLYACQARIAGYNVSMEMRAEDLGK
jgi:hypothetical protein